MTLSDTAPFIEYNGDDSTVAFPTGFEFAANGDLVVVVVDSSNSPTVQIITTHYTVSGAGNSGGGTVTMVTAPATGETLQIYRWVSVDQLSDYLNNDNLDSEVLENDFDKMVMLVQQILQKLGGTSFSVEDFNFLARSSTNLEEWDADSKQIANLPAPVDPNDAVRKTYVDTITSVAGNMPTGDPADNFLVSNGTSYVTQTLAQARTTLGPIVTDLTSIASFAKGRIIAADGTDYTDLAVGSDEQVLLADSSQNEGLRWGLTPLPPNHLSGLVLSRENADDLNITDGKARDSADGQNLVLSSEITKQIDATWSAGDDAGGLSSSLSAPANNTWYHVHLIEVSGSVDVGFDTSITAANLVADHSATSYRRIGSARTNGSAQITEFIMYRFGGMTQVLWLDPSYETDSLTAGTQDFVSLLVPTGLRVMAKLNLHTTGTADSIYLRTPDVNNEAPSTTAGPLATISDWGGVAEAGKGIGPIEILTDTSAQIRARCTVNTTLSTSVLGWIE